MIAEASGVIGSAGRQYLSALRLQHATMKKVHNMHPGMQRGLGFGAYGLGSGFHRTCEVVLNSSTVPAAEA